MNRVSIYVALLIQTVVLVSEGMDLAGEHISELQPVTSEEYHQQADREQKEYQASEDYIAYKRRHQKDMHRNNVSTSNQQIIELPQEQVVSVSLRPIASEDQVAVTLQKQADTMQQIQRTQALQAQNALSNAFLLADIRSAAEDMPKKIKKQVVKDPIDRKFNTTVGKRIAKGIKAGFAQVVHMRSAFDQHWEHNLQQYDKKSIINERKSAKKRRMRQEIEEALLTN